MSQRRHEMIDLTKRDPDAPPAPATDLWLPELHRARTEQTRAEFKARYQPADERRRVWLFLLMLVLGHSLAFLTGLLVAR